MDGYFGYRPILDEEFDAPDAAADRDLCRALVAGKWGLHPDVWGSHDPLATLPPHWRKPLRYREPPPPYVPSPMPVDWPRPTPRPKPDFSWRERTTTRSPTYPVSSYTTGEVQLTCDDCRRGRLDRTVCHGEHGRPAAVEVIRAMGRDVGWTCTAGRDRCPKCSQVSAPEAKGNGASPDQGNEQHA